jgi:rhodanese-related sulfurtransferase
MIEKRDLKKMARQSFNIILFASFLAFIVNLFHPKGYIPVEKASLNKKKVFITAVEAKIKFDHSSALFIDSRDEDEFAVSHIPGAVCIQAVPEAMFKSGISRHKNVIQSAIEIVIYCDKNCGSAEFVADRLFSDGYSRHVYLIKGGFPEWTGVAYPVEKNMVESGVKK